MPLKVSVFILVIITTCTREHIHKGLPTTVINDTLSPSDVTDLSCLCGVPENAEYKLNQDDDDHHDDDDDHHDDLLSADRVMGGEITRRTRYPWTVRVVWVCPGPRGLAKFTTCSASLVTPRLLASATHCFSESLEAVRRVCRPGGQLMVDTGVNSEKVLDKMKLFKIKKIIAGEGSCPFSDFGDPGCHDFCLILLQRPVSFSNHLRPICLPDPGQDFSGMKATSIGWGMFKIRNPKVL